MRPKRRCNSSDEEIELRRGPWTLQEDTLLIHYISSHGEGRWNFLAQSAGLKRSGKSCRLRWLNYLKPDIKRGNLSPQEQLLILELHSKWGNRWSKIAQNLPGRTDNEIKNYWRTRVQRQARQLNIDSNSKDFVDAIRCVWMPRLLQKVEQTSSCPSNTSMNSQKCNGNFSPSPNSTVSNTPFPTLCSSLPTQFPNPNIFSSDSMKIQEIPQNPSSNSSDFCNSSVYNSCANDYYNGYDMDEALNLTAMSAMEGYNMSPSDCQLAESRWVVDDVADTLWTMDDTWQ